AGAHGAFFGLIGWLMRKLSRLDRDPVAHGIGFRSIHTIYKPATYVREWITIHLETGRFSTGC
ncbi:MAG: hypothetical protein ABIS50_00615, partial [Luteolibacter sp.]|uniref:hypothetical protein n=1 Tax=Luteolibacter sp. TaxID=1962973 RepID=UPI00326577CD